MTFLNTIMFAVIYYVDLSLVNESTYSADLLYGTILSAGEHAAPGNQLAGR